MVSRVGAPADLDGGMRDRVRLCIARSGLTQRDFAQQIRLNPDAPKLSKSGRIPTNHRRAYLRWYRAVRDVVQEGQEAGVLWTLPSTT